MELPVSSGNASIFGSTRLDIAYDVHQCARFSHAPKHSHKIGIKHIIRHLKGTRNKYMIMKPSRSDLQLNLFEDANFAGLFASEDKEDHVSIKSRTGILLHFEEVPILWLSKLQ